VASAPTLIALFVTPGAEPVEDEDDELLEAFEHDAKMSAEANAMDATPKVRAVRRVNVPPESRR
jgi:hypothetical protein